MEGVKQEKQELWEATSVKGFAFISFEAVFDNGATIGGGVVPLCAGHFDGAKQIILPVVLHSINAPSQWYGSSQVLDRWQKDMIDSVCSANKDIVAGYRTSWILSQD